MSMPNIFNFVVEEQSGYALKGDSDNYLVYWDDKDMPDIYDVKDIQRLINNGAWVITSQEHSSNLSIEERLFERVLRFMKDNKISCSETVYQCDWVIENAYEFIDDLREIIDPYLTKDDENNEE